MNKARDPAHRTSRWLVRRRAGSQRNFLSSLIEVILIVAAAFVLALLIQHFIVKPFRIPSVSMEPTLRIGDRVLINRLGHRFSSPSRGDVVVFKSPQLGGQDLIKRVVAVGGDRVEIKEGRLYVNGEAQEEPYVREPMNGDMAELRVPPGCIFVMGDNRNDSADSRVFGPVDIDQVLGKAFMIYWPLSRLGGL